MAIARFTLTCPTCGQEFEVRKQCTNRKAADSYEDWAKAYPYDCPECYKKAKKADAEAKAAKVTAHIAMPEITGVSEKQIQFATDLRTKYLTSDHPVYDFWDKLIDSIRNGNFAKKIEKDTQDGTSTAEAIYNFLERAGMQVLVILHATPDANDIIELLRGNEWDERLWLQSTAKKQKEWITHLTAAAYYKLEEELKSAPTPPKED